ncbi:MAG: hypothetical protein AAFN27_05545 [Pseudomonadota bacterium]
MIAKGGVHLADHFEEKSPKAILHKYDPDAIVLQDYSTVALDFGHAGRSARALMSFCKYVTIKKVLFATWPREDGHKLYQTPGMPKTSAAMNTLVEQHYTISSRCQSMSERAATRVAPVGHAWILGTGLPLHRQDGYHASLTGAWLSALVLARTMGLAPDMPVAPKGVKVPGRLTQIARIVAP